MYEEQSMKIIAAVVLGLWLVALLVYIVLAASETFRGPRYARYLKGLGLVLGITAFVLVGGFCLHVLSR